MNNDIKMDELDKNLPDDFWRKTFDEAAETPPPRVWAAIERKLDEADGPKVVLLWGWATSRPLIWGTGLAAAVALLLVGWWVVNTASTSSTPVAHTQLVAPSENVVPLPGRTRSTAPATTGNSTANVTGKPVNEAPKDALASTERSSRLNPGRPRRDAAGHIVRVNDTHATLAKNRPAFDSGLSARQQHIAAVAMSQRPQSTTFRVAAVSYAADQHRTSSVQAFGSSTVAAFDKLSGKPLRLRTLGAIQRIVWARAAAFDMEPEMSKSKQKSRELWASVSMMPGSFNPSVSLRSAQQAFTNTSIVASTASNQSAVSSRANFSVAYQAGAGVQLNDRWSVESGIGYLSGRSTVETPGQQYLATAQMDALANRNTGLNNLYVDALRNSTRSTDLASAPQANYLSPAANGNKATASYNSQSLQAITNDYQYVQVPVQIGYQFRPRKKLSMAVLGGLLTNIFVKNTVGDAVVVTGKDGVYRPVTLAATMGARLRYRPTRQWSASVAGVYQPSLEAGTTADSQVQNRPTSAGMSFGVDYHF